MRRLSSAGDVVMTLGGIDAVVRLTESKSRNVVWNWLNAGAFPPNTYVVMVRALERRDCTASARLWQMRGIQKQRRLSNEA
jgi:hypothetical protein